MTQYGTVYSEDGALTEDGLRLVIEEAKKATQTDRAVSISDVADFSILKQDVSHDQFCKEGNWDSKERDS
jgi:hypothetical protein